MLRCSHQCIKFIAHLCVMRINFYPVWTHVWSQAGIGQQCLQSLRCFYVMVSKRNYGERRASFTDHMHSFHPFTRYPPWQFFCFESRLEFTRGMTVVPYEGVGSFARRAFKISANLQCLLRRVCVPEVTYQDFVFELAEIHVQAPWTGLYRRIRTTKNVTRSIFLEMSATAATDTLSLVLRRLATVARCIRAGIW